MDAVKKIGFGGQNRNPLPGSRDWNKREQNKRKPQEVQIPLYIIVEDDIFYKTPSHKPSPEDRHFTFN